MRFDGRGSIRSSRVRRWRPGDEAVDDFVLRRADGVAAYQLAVVVDDIAMAITRVVRGDDLLRSTPRQLALYRALGAAPPAFVHVPLVWPPAASAWRSARARRRSRRCASAAWRPLPIVGALAASAGLASTGARAPAQMASSAIMAVTLRRGVV